MLAAFTWGDLWRLALAVFVGARGFAHEHQSGAGIARAEDGLRAGGGKFRATRAAGDFRLDDFEESGAFGGGDDWGGGGGRIEERGRGGRFDRRGHCDDGWLLWRFAA